MFISFYIVFIYCRYPFSQLTKLSAYLNFKVGNVCTVCRPLEYNMFPINGTKTQTATDDSDDECYSSRKDLI